MISIITAWAGETGGLLADFYRSVEGGLAEVISIDNACPPATADALKEMTEHLCGMYVRNETNLGFAAANNQGYARATGDIIIFLNSDVAPAGPWLHQVLHEVRGGALYGPSLAHQLVYGMWLPYLEGWCIAATRGTWRKLCRLREPNPDVLSPIEDGPWDALAYPSPYWEDNDLCLRAFLANIELQHTQWPIQHKGGQTAGALIKHGASFERNRAMFAERVRGVWEKKMDIEGLPR